MPGVSAILAWYSNKMRIAGNPLPDDIDRKAAEPDAVAMVLLGADNRLEGLSGGAGSVSFRWFGWLAVSPKQAVARKAHLDPGRHRDARNLNHLIGNAVGRCSRALSRGARVIYWGYGRQGKAAAGWE